MLDKDRTTALFLLQTFNYHFNSTNTGARTSSAWPLPDRRAHANSTQQFYRTRYSYKHAVTSHLRSALPVPPKNGPRFCYQAQRPLRWKPPWPPQSHRTPAATRPQLPSPAHAYPSQREPVRREQPAVPLRGSEHQQVENIQVNYTSYKRELTKS